MAWDPITYKGGSTKLVSTTGEGNDWIKLMAQRQPRKEEVIRSLLESVKQAVEKKADSNGTRPIKETKGLASFGTQKHWRLGRC